VNIENKMNSTEQESLFNEENKKNSGLGNLQLERPLVVFDLETTGLDIRNDRIIQFAFIRVNPDRTQDEWVELVNPGIKIPPESIEIHGITNEKVKDKANFSHFAPFVVEFLENCDLSGYNVARFDLPFLQKEMERSEVLLDVTGTKVIDAQIIFHKLEPRNLAAAYRFYCGEEHDDAHDALGDVKVTLDVLNAQVGRYSELPNSIAGLHEFTNKTDDRYVTPDRKFFWRHGQASIGFGKYKGRSLKWIYENDRDYLNWMKGGDFADETKKMIADVIQGIFPKKKEATDKE
jgi:DNA polymerase III subunit epsilon